MMDGFISWAQGWGEQLFRRFFHLVVKLVLVMVFTTLMGLGVAWLLFWSQMLGVIVIKWLVVMALGISSGIFARIIFYHNTFSMSWLSAWIAQGVCLLLLNNLTMDQIGFNLSPVRSAVINWDGLGQLAAGAILAWAALSVWKTSSLRTVTPVVSSPGPVTQALNVPQSPPAPVSPTLQSSVAVKKKTTRRLKTQTVPKMPPHPQSSSSSWSLGQMTTRLQNRVHATANALTSKLKSSPASAELKIQRSVQKKQKPLKPVSTSLPKRLHKSRHSPIHLIGEEEHRCPYCLDAVDPKDPEGVVVCSICHTYHHKSCWDITGTCQVPHIYS